MLVIGIDPGISGSICFFNDGKIIDVVEMPTMTEGKKNKKQVNGAQIFNEISERIKKLDKRINFLENKSLQEVKNAQKKAFIQALKKNNIPFREFKIKNFSENTLGEFFSYFMLETAIVGKLANINPFNQPAVQQVKIDTKQLLV